MGDRPILDERLGLVGPGPLGAEARVIGHDSLVLAAVDVEDGFAVAPGRRCEDVDLVIIALRQIDRDGLPAVQHVFHVGFAAAVFDAAMDDHFGHELGSIGVALLIHLGDGLERVARNGVLIYRKIHKGILDRRGGHGSLRQRDLIGLGSKMPGIDEQPVAFESCFPDRFLDSVHLLGRNDPHGESQLGAAHLPARRLEYTDDITAAVLGLLKRLDGDLRGRSRDKREPASQLPGMLRRREAEERLIEQLAFLHHPGAVMVAIVPDERVSHRMASEIQIPLVGIAFLGRRRMQQTQAQGIVGGFVPAVFRIVQNGDAIVPVREVCPMMGECFVRPLVVGGTALVADADVVDSLLGGNGHREFGLEQGVGRLPVDVGHDVDTLVVPAVGQADILHQPGIAVPPFYFQGGPCGAALRHADPDIRIHGFGCLVERRLVDLPCRIAVRHIGGQHRKAEGPAFFDQIAAVAFVDDRGDVAVGIERHLIDPVLERIARSPEHLALAGLAGPHVVYRIAYGFHRGGKQHGRPGTVAGNDLRRNGLPVRRINGHPFGLRRQVDRRLDKAPARISGGVINQYRTSLRAGVHYGCRSPGRGEDHIAELSLRQEFVVPGIGISLPNAGSRKVVVELVPEETLPGIVKRLFRIRYGSHPVGDHGRTLGGIGQLFVTAVVTLHLGLGGITARSVDVEGHLPDEHRKFRMVPVRHIILVELRGRGADKLHGPLAVRNPLLEQLDAAGQGRAAVVSGSVRQFVAIVPVSDAERRLPGAFGQFLVGAQIPFGKLVPRIASRLERHHDAGAVDPFPEPDRKRGFGVADKRLGAPRQFLRRETDQAAVVSQRRHDLAESEAVGQEHILRLDAELLFIKLLCKQDVADKRLRRRHVRVVGLERSPRNVPSPVGYEFPDALEEVRIVLLDPFVLDGTFEIEHVMRIFFEQRQILHSRII